MRAADVLLIVTEPYYRSLETAARIGDLARELGIPHVFVVANKVRSDQEERLVREFCAARGLPVLAVLPYDEAVHRADEEGRAPLEAAPEGPFVRAVQALAAQILALRVQGVQTGAHR